MFFLSLAPVDNASLVLSTIVQALRIPGAGAGDALATLERRLRDARALLVLDNLEQVIDVARTLA